MKTNDHNASPAIAEGTMIKGLAKLYNRWRHSPKAKYVDASLL